MRDKEFLHWLKERLVCIYKENESVDFVQKLNGIINNYPENKVSKPAFKVENKLFENIKFGDKFITANNTIVIFLHTVDSTSCGKYRFGSNLETFTTDEEGRVMDSPGLNIVSRYNEPIDNDKLEEIIDKKYFNVQQPSQRDYDLANAFRAGYLRVGYYKEEDLEKIAEKGRGFGKNCRKRKRIWKKLQKAVTMQKYPLMIG